VYRGVSGVSLGEVPSVVLAAAATCCSSEEDEEEEGGGGARREAAGTTSCLRRLTTSRLCRPCSIESRISWASGWSLGGGCGVGKGKTSDRS